MKITFYGGAKTVTGANYLLDHGDIKIIIDCGLNQGSKYAEDMNYEKFTYDPTQINFVFITHSHMDHIGRLPQLYKEGFRGTVYATEPTKEIMAVAYPDALEKMTSEANDRGQEPLYGEKETLGVLALTKGIKYKEKINLGSGLGAMLHDAGHILGSSMVEINDGNSRTIFSGDLGNPPMPLLNPPDYVEGVDYAIIESTYGSRIHEDKPQRRILLQEIIRDTISRSGVLMTPSFAIERTQEILFEIDGLIDSGKIPRVPVFLDSPLAINITHIYQKFPEYLNKNAMEIIRNEGGLYSFPWLKFTSTVQESKSINNISGPKIIIAGSGMSNGGRILHHEQRYLSDPKSTLLIVGYQAEGTLGRRILDGAKEVKIFGETVPVKCLVRAIGGYSAHADQPGLLKFLTLANKGRTLKKAFCVQGEEDSATVLAEKAKTDLKIDAVVPSQGESFEL